MSWVDFFMPNMLPKAAAIRAPIISPGHDTMQKRVRLGTRLGLTLMLRRSGERRDSVRRAVLPASLVVGHTQLLRAGLDRSSMKFSGSRLPSSTPAYDP